MLKIGLTGGVAAGKSAVAIHFADLGVAVVDTDLIARELTADGSPAVALIAQKLGCELVEAGRLDRRRLRARIFADPASRSTLEGLLHPPIRDAVRARLARLEADACPCVVVVVPLLAEHRADWLPLFDRVVVVDCDPATQRARLMQRDGIDGALADAMLDAQSPRAARLELADAVIVNEDGLSVLADAVREVWGAWCGHCE